MLHKLLKMEILKSMRTFKNVWQNACMRYKNIETKGIKKNECEWSADV